MGYSGKIIRKRRLTGEKLKYDVTDSQRYVMLSYARSIGKYSKTRKLFLPESGHFNMRQKLQRKKSGHKFGQTFYGRALNCGGLLFCKFLMEACFISLMDRFLIILLIH